VSGFVLDFLRHEILNELAPQRAVVGDNENKNILTFISNNITVSEGLIPHTCLLFCNREGRSAPETPRWKVAGRQSSSVSVLLPIGAAKRRR
jgi:hypothetical protein